MDFTTIRAWVDEVTQLGQHDQAPQQAKLAQHIQLPQRARPTLLIRRPLNPLDPLDQISSPPKRKRTSDHNARAGPDETPTRARSQRRPDGDVFTEAADPASRSVASATSSFAAVLATRPVFSAAATQHHATSETSRTKASSRSSSPSKQALKVPSLLDLAIPVSFTNPRVLEDVLPSDAQRLSESLSVVAGKEGILPAALRHHADFAGSRVRPFMWAPAGVNATADEDQTALENHERLQDITDESTTSLALSRSEAAWNCRVHGPFLKFALRHADGIDFEPITSAQIMPSFRPMFKSNDSAASGHDSAQSQNRPSARVSFTHKMADFALVLKPDERLQTLISDFLDGEKHATASINQTKYEPLRKRPASIFIETKTLSGTVESARVQLGVWIAAWHERMRSIIALGGKVKPVITVPVIQVFDGLWTLFFVVDGGTETRILDSNLQIGDTDTILGVYQLQAAMSVLAGWAKETFEPWLIEVLTGAIANRP